MEIVAIAAVSIASSSAELIFRVFVTDAYPKPLEEFRTRTFWGGIVSLVAVAHCCADVNAVVEICSSGILFLVKGS